MNKENIIAVAVVVIIIFAALVFAIISVPELIPVEKETWYMIPGECPTMVPEYAELCHITTKCGMGYFTKSLEGHDPAILSEAWKLPDGLVEINYDRCVDDDG